MDIIVQVGSTVLNLIVLGAESTKNFDFFFYYHVNAGVDIISNTSRIRLLNRDDGETLHYENSLSGNKLTLSVAERD